MTLKALGALVLTFLSPPTEREQERAIIKRQTSQNCGGGGGSSAILRRQSGKQKKRRGVEWRVGVSSKEMAAVESKERGNIKEETPMKATFLTEIVIDNSGYK